jgi:hypothetical protein
MRRIELTHCRSSKAFALVSCFAFRCAANVPESPHGCGRIPGSVGEGIKIKSCPSVMEKQRRSLAGRTDKGTSSRQARQRRKMEPQAPTHFAFKKKWNQLAFWLSFPTRFSVSPAIALYCSDPCAQLANPSLGLRVRTSELLCATSFRAVTRSSNPREAALVESC